MEKITWAPKVRQALIEQLYLDDAAGMVDPDLVEDVGFRLYHRCRSIDLVTRQALECPRCGTEMRACEPGSWKLLPGALVCPAPGCGWETTAGEWAASWRHRDLLGSAAVPAVEAYLRDYPRAKTPEARMLCIDQFIHAFHISLRTGLASRSFANNLIEGSHLQVIAFLDRLSAMPGGVDKDQWRGEVGAMLKRRQGG